MKIILIGNYSLDKQESMKRFTFMLNDGFNKKGIETEIWEPIVFFAFMFKNSTSGSGKWLGYVDKWLLFPIILKFRLFKKKYKDKSTRFHICDHSNAAYLKFLPQDRVVITCHDVLAIRGALGYTDAYCPASGMGKILQKWILNNLKKANRLAAVSHFTLNQLKDLIDSNVEKTKNWVVIHNAFNAEFEPLNVLKSKNLLQEMGVDTNIPYVLHVGSALERKNRKLLLYMIDKLGSNWNGKICFAGKSMDSKLVDLAKKLDLEDRVISVIRPTHEGLLALYSSAEAFIFPSLSEGFGWPLIEAQACGAPVIASSFEPMPEVSNNTAIHVHPEDAEGFAKAFLSLRNTNIRDNIIESGFKNIERFRVEKMIVDYIGLHQN
ncbi:Glycosyltransferase involved in cell wall bisynthesis [Flaviramulus basaltis]|uniref:Glycosyltransferase involved in cell wall bisynthesis n=1 Tax=Flaviramulus basaltis TaxID=369401 RepID=A0A1K2INS7_9FLAO|nr:glycosyltransferase family 1 protein [Flaviramulus basaltis]SFZ94031.1 Glycosyltransferase involved in cell wall bisynthesis [Flaviramulus basaltis]